MPRNVASARAPAPRGRRKPRGSRASERLVAALARPETYPDRPASVEVRETHISWVFLAGERAYKLKKPVVLPFLDYGTAARRRKMCHEEVRLNRRLAADVYVGVRGVAERPDGFELTAEDDPKPPPRLALVSTISPRERALARTDRGPRLRLRCAPCVGRNRELSEGAGCCCGWL